MTDGVSWGASRSFFIRTCDPTLTASFAYTPTSPMVGQNVQFTAISGQGGDGCGSLEYRWLVDDVERQGWSASPAFDHQFTSGGSHSVRLDKRSEGGAPASSTQTVNVTGPPPLSVAITFGPSNVKPSFPDCQWRATVQGGQPPYRYSWKLTMTTPTSNFTLNVIASYGKKPVQSDTATLVVSVSSGAPPCP
jgi:PKD repeat protein